MKTTLIAACAGLCLTPAQVETLQKGIEALQVKLNESEQKAQRFEKLYNEEKKKLCT